MRHALICCLILLALAACSKKSQSNDTEGTWIEASDRKDTLRFMEIDGRSFMSLTTAERNAAGIPPFSTGLYTIDVMGNEIVLNWTASSSTAVYRYPYSVKGNELHIGNFYKPNLPSSFILTFKRL
jgi:hypothetical protein